MQGLSLRRFALAVGASALVVGCESIIGADFGGAQRRITLPSDAGTDAPADAAPAPSAPPCDPLVPLAHPSDLAAATDSIEFTVVVRAADYGDGAVDGGAAAYASVGYDLDGVCTSGLSTSSCTPRPWIGSVTEDGPRGQDNAVGHLLAVQARIFGRQVIGSEIMNAAVAQGVYAPVAVLRVHGFGGLSEDDHVDVDWFVAAPPAVPGDGGTAAAPKPPAFDATDHWPILWTSVIDGTASSAAATVSVHRDTHAFVTKNTLVAHFDHVQVPIGNVYFNVADVVLTGKVGRSNVNDDWRLDDAAFAGHGSTDDLLGVIPEIAFKLFGVSLCTDNQANYPTVKRYICESADFPGASGAPRDTPCVGSSVGAALVTAPASLGALVPPEPRPNLCTPMTDPRNESCATPPGGG